MSLYLSESSGAGLFRIAQFQIVLRELVNEPFCTVFRSKVSETEDASREPYCPSNQAADPLLRRTMPGHRVLRAGLIHPPRLDLQPRFDAALGPDLTSAGSYRPGEEEMFLASKKMGTEIVFALLLSTTFAASLPSFAAEHGFSEEALAVVSQNDVRKMQQVLFDRGQYRGKVDGVMGLRTRESIRAFQRAEKLPATGHLDPQTAGKLGVNPEFIRKSAGGAKRDIVAGKDKSGNQAAKSKPWAGIILAKTARQTSRTVPKVPSGADPEDNSQKSHGDGEQ